jgi:hypothetical protein
MNKDAMYFAVFAVLCVLAGVLVGASITKRAYGPGPMPGMSGFNQRAEHFMGYGRHEPGMRGHRQGGNGLFTTLVSRLELDQTQQAKVKEILEKARQDIETVGQGVRSSMNQIRGNSDRQIMAILTPQQQEKFKALQAEAKKRGNRKGNAFRCRLMPRPGMNTDPSGELPPPPAQE